jgi:hypothetical protein
MIKAWAILIYCLMNSLPPPLVLWAPSLVMHGLHLKEILYVVRYIEIIDVHVHTFLSRVRTCTARGKAIGLSVACCLSSVDPKIAISRDLGTWATRKHNESTELGEKLAFVCFKLRDMTSGVAIYGSIRAKALVNCHGALSIDQSSV